MELVHDRRRGGGDADAIEVGDDREQEREAEDTGADRGHFGDRL